MPNCSVAITRFKAGYARKLNHELGMNYEEARPLAAEIFEEISKDAEQETVKLVWSGEQTWYAFEAEVCCCDCANCMGPHGRG